MTNPYPPTPPPSPNNNFGQTPPPPPYPVQQNNNSNALASMVMGITGLVMMPLGIILGPLAVCFSRKARKQIATSNESGENYAKIGKITGIIASCIGTLAIAFYAVFFSIIFGGFSLFDIDSFHNEYDEKETIRDMNSLADDLDDYFDENNKFPSDSQMLDGTICNESLLSEIKSGMEYVSLRRDELEDGWGRQIVYDCLTGANAVNHINDAFRYDKNILRKANPDTKATYILWSKGADLEDPSDDIYFIKGRGIVRPDGYKGNGKKQGD